MNGEESETQFYYVWKKDNEALSSISKIIISEQEDPETLEIISIPDKEILEANPNNAGIANELFFKQQKIVITAENFGLTANYRCDVFTSFAEAVQEYLLLNKNQDTNLIIPE